MKNWVTSLLSRLRLMLGGSDYDTVDGRYLGRFF
jgi:hypothetical protein